MAYLRRRGVDSAALLPNGSGVAGPSGTRTPRSTTAAHVSSSSGTWATSRTSTLCAYFEDSVRPELDRLGVAVDLTVMGPDVTDELVARFPLRPIPGFVPDLSAALRSIDVSVVPLRLGGGTKLKVLDVMAAGVPVVTTSVGAEGLEVEDGVHLLVADSPEAFAGAVARLLGRRRARRGPRESGSRLVEQTYSWQFGAGPGRGTGGRGHSLDAGCRRPTP